MAAEQQVSAIISAALATAAAKAGEASAYSSQAITASSGYAVAHGGVVDFRPRDVEPKVNIPQNAAGLDTAMFDSTYGRILADLTDQFERFFNEHFSDECNTIAKAQQWICDVLSGQESGLPPAVENQIWERDRARISADANRAAQEIASAVAARGFPFPTGVVSHGTYMAQVEAQKQIGDSSRERAIEQARINIENLRFAVSQAIDYRVKAIQAAGDYIKTLAVGPEIATRLATSAAGAQAQLISAAAGWYNARLKVEEMRLSALETTSRNITQAGAATVSAHGESIKARANTLSAAARAAGDQAAAALNAVHASAAIAVHGETE